ncbi:uncharacterized protein LOC127464216 [Manacus candei]|uniref:uncharacterized protein LOC127464216 n=1 Tax=Manacus candei TaxID=415023 RepID=UPI002226C971|nr:uncharacterized protein LOC127464216 [Manacus candei]
MLNDSSSAHSMPKYSRQYSLEHVHGSSPYAVSAPGEGGDLDLWEQGPGFVGRGNKALDLWRGNKALDLWEGNKDLDLWKGEQGPGFVGRGQGPGFVEREQDPGFVGREQGPGFVEREQGPGFVEREQGPGFVGREQGPGFVGREQDPGFLGRGTRPRFGLFSSDFPIVNPSLPFSVGIGKALQCGCCILAQPEPLARNSQGRLDREGGLGQRSRCWEWNCVHGAGSKVGIVEQSQVVPVHGIIPEAVGWESLGMRAGSSSGDEGVSCKLQGITEFQAGLGGKGP